MKYPKGFTVAAGLLVLGAAAYLKTGWVPSAPEALRDALVQPLGGQVDDLVLELKKESAAMDSPVIGASQNTIPSSVDVPVKRGELDTSFSKVIDEKKPYSMEDVDGKWYLNLYILSGEQEGRFNPSRALGLFYPRVSRGMSGGGSDKYAEEMLISHQASLPTSHQKISYYVDFPYVLSAHLG